MIINLDKPAGDASSLQDHSGNAYDYCVSEVFSAVEFPMLWA